MRDKPWPGYHRDTTELGEESWVQFENFQMQTLGELRDRPGLGQRYTLQADVLTFLETGSVRTLIGFRGTSIKSVDIVSGSTYTLKTGLNTAIGSFANCLAAVYYVNGVDAPQVIYNGSIAAQSAGIIAPASAPTAGASGAGVITAGIHLIRYRYKNNTTGYLSNPSPALSFTAAGSQNCPLTMVASTDPKVDKIVVEMTQADGDTFYIVATTTNTTSYTINMSDLTLGAQQQANIFASPDGFGHEPPPTSLIAIHEHRNRLFGLSSDGTLYWSRSSFPEAWNALNWGKKVFATGGDKPIAMASFYNDLYIFGSRGMARLVYTGDPASGMLVQMPSAFGVFSQRSVVTAEGVIYGYGRDGLWAISAMQPTLVSDVVKPVLDTADYDYASTFHMFFDPNERVVWAMFRAEGSSGVKNAVVYDLSAQEWSGRSFRHAITAGCAASTAVTPSAAYLADSGNYCWRLDYNTWDAVPASMTSGVVTATTGSTTTVINVTQSLDTAQGLAGAILYNEATGEEILITGNAVGSVTLATPLATAPTVGQEYFIGSISQVIESGWIPQSIDRDGIRATFMCFNHLSVTGSTGVLFKVEYFFDYSSSPFQFTSSPDDAMLHGLSIVNARNYATSLLDHGITRVPMPSNWNVVARWRITRTKPQGYLRLTDAGVEIELDRKAKQVAQ